MAVWLVRAGKLGEYDDWAIEHNRIAIGWRRMPDLTALEDRARTEAAFRRVYPEVRESRAKSHAGQLHTFAHRMGIGDLAILPIGSRSTIAIGEITGPYTYTDSAGDEPRHTRSIEWRRPEIPRSAFDDDLLYSFGAMLTVYRVQRHDAERRIRAMLAAGAPQREPASPEEPTIDLEQTARDQLVRFVASRFHGHALAGLVNHLLRAEGYLTRMSPPGPDGGVDILAGSGRMGFDHPRLCVQVKSGTTPVGVKVFRELRGTMQQFHADQGLLVSWGGFRATVRTEAASSFFTVRLWDARDILDALFAAYDRLPDSVQTELPLKRIWVLMNDD